MTPFPDSFPMKIIIPGGSGQIGTVLAGTLASLSAGKDVIQTQSGLVRGDSFASLSAGNDVMK